MFIWGQQGRKKWSYYGGGKTEKNDAVEIQLVLTFDLADNIFLVSISWFDPISLVSFIWGDG